MAAKPGASQDFVKLAHTIQERKNEIVARRRHILRSLDVQVYSSDDCRSAAGEMFVKQRSRLNMSMTAGLRSSQTSGGGSSRRGSQDSAGKPSLSKLESLRSIITHASLLGDDDEDVFEGKIVCDFFCLPQYGWASYSH